MMNISSTKELISFLKEKLSPIYDSAEAENLAFLVAEDFLGLNKSDYVLNSTINNIDISRIDSILERLLKHEPIQHIKGEVVFYDLQFKVSKDTLIPRPETEELIHLIVTKHKTDSDLKIIDYCTGSGCIAISLDKNLDAKTTAYDISHQALIIAKGNNTNNKTTVEFKEIDILNNIPSENNIDIIVSNPPYVLESEKVLMNKNVLDYDPHLALFVEDNEALIFYDKISNLAAKQLKTGGFLYFEINENFGEETKQLVLSKGFSKAEVIKDFQGKDRFLVAELLGL